MYLLRAVTFPERSRRNVASVGGRGGVSGRAAVPSQGAGGRLRLGLPVAALVLGGLVLVLAAAAVPLAQLAHQSLNAATATSPVWVTAPGAVVGFVVAWRKPGNPLGWIFLGAAALSMLTEDASLLRGGRLPAASWRAAAGLGGVAGPAQLSLLSLVLLGLIFLLFPDGRPPSPRWRWVLWAYAGIGLVWITWSRRHHGGRDHQPPHRRWIPAGSCSLLSGDRPGRRVVERGGKAAIFLLLAAVLGWPRWRARWPAGGARRVSAASS